MFDISLHLLDLLENAADAGARNVALEITEDPSADSLTVSVSDDGRGMTSDEVRRALDPFYSSKPKKVGLGLPMAALAARMAGGEVSLDSAPGKGTTVKVCFRLSHIDRQPLGDLGGTLVAFLAGHAGVRLTFRYKGPGGHEFSFDSAEGTSGADASRSQIAFLSWAEDKIRAGLAVAGFAPDRGGIGVEVHRGS